MLAILLLSALVCLAPGAVRAADIEGKFVTRGIGNKTCQDYAEAYAAGGPALHDYVLWIDGYLQLTNRLRPETAAAFRAGASSEVEDKLYVSCVRAPRDRVVSSIAALLSNPPEGRPAPSTTAPRPRGLDNRACKDYVAALDKGLDPVHKYLVWMEGYLTAANRLMPETFDALPVVAIGPTASIIYGTCKMAPDKMLEGVVDMVLAAYRPYRVQRSSQLIEVAIGDVYAPIRQETMVLIQRELLAQNLYKGSTDGQFSPALRLALLEYQEQKKITKSGAPDAATILNLIKDSQRRQQQ